MRHVLLPSLRVTQNWRLNFCRVNYSNKYLTNDPITINIHKILVLSIQNTTGNRAEKTVPTSTALNGATPFRIRVHGWIWNTWNNVISIVDHTGYFKLSIYQSNLCSNQYLPIQQWCQWFLQQYNQLLSSSLVKRGHIELSIPIKDC